MNLPLNVKLDHVGVVVANIEETALAYAEAFGAEPTGPIVFDPTQKVNIQFVRLNDGTRIELIQPVGEDSPVRRTLQKGGGPVHLCYEVDDIEAAVEVVVASHAICVCPPVPAPAFGGRRVAFVFKKHVGLVEFVEAP